MRILRHVMNYRIVRQTLPLIMVLRKRHFSFLLLASRADCGDKSATMSTNTTKEASYPVNIANGILLYYYQYSYYSQKVVLALHEKNLPFESHIINLNKAEQYEPWFLQINSKGEVPVLQDTGKIIPDSTRIIDYLEDNFSNGDTPRLMPMDQGAEVRQKVTRFRTKIDQISGGTITNGALLHPELTTNPKIPFIAPVRKALANDAKNSASNLRKKAELVPEARETLLQKAQASEKNFALVSNKEEFLTVLQKVEDVLDEVELELKSHTNESFWLCTDRFTVADVSLTILLERLNQLGLETRFWTNGKRPNIEKYYGRVQERDSYKKTIPNKFLLLKMLIMSQSPLVIGISLATAVALIIGGVFWVKKLIVSSIKLNTKGKPPEFSLESP